MVWMYVWIVWATPDYVTCNLTVTKETKKNSAQLDSIVKKRTASSLLDLYPSDGDNENTIRRLIRRTFLHGTKMDYESASQRSLSTSPNLVLCYVRIFLLECSIWITMDPIPGLLKNGA
jgi:hypothetical protein